MEIARIRILPQFEIEKRRKFEDREHRCQECSGELTLELFADPDSPHVLEEAHCKDCKTPPRKRVFTLN